MTVRVAVPLSLFLLVVAALPATAPADRAPTARERAGVARAIGVPKRCVRIRVATVAHPRRWASARMRNAKASCSRWHADGVAIFKRRKQRGARWRFVTAGSAFDCPVPKVPNRVERDLRIPCQ